MELGAETRMMELTDSSDELSRVRDESRHSAEETRSGIGIGLGLGIDLNEIPSPSLHETLPDSFEVVRNFHDNPPPPLGGPAELPSAENDAGAGNINHARRSSGACGACGGPEVKGQVVVCDGCERGFHIGCAGRQVLSHDEWICTECECSGVKSKRWPLGVKSKRILDINSSPPSDADADGEATVEILGSRKHTPGDNSFGRNPFGAPVTFPNFLYAGNGFGFQKASGILTHTVKLGFEDILQHSQSTNRKYEEVDLGFPLGRCKSSNNTVIRRSSPNPSDIFLQALRDFVSERHGVLEEGWRVDFRRSMGNCELCAVYCAPDGKIFDSVYEVACYLGLKPNFNTLEPEVRSEGSQSMSGRSHLSRKRKSSRISIANGFAENKEILTSDNHKELSSNGLTMEVCSNTVGNNVKVTEAGTEENAYSGSQQSKDGFPVQFEDFFVLSLGELDARASYHDVSQIWPVGYRSCWHDKITGSLFMCEVSDGGDSGPIFRVRRCSCSVLSIPNGVTVICRQNLEQFVDQINEEINDITSHDMDCDNDSGIQTILSDPCPPSENDILSCLRSCSNGACDVQTLGDLGLRDEIGEILVEDRSSSSAWKKVAKKIITACSEVCERKGTLKFFCKHVENEISIPNSYIASDKSQVNWTLLSKFCSSQASLSIPSVFWADNELETSFNVLEKWLEQDRFGLDAEFVQEIIEQLPGVQACSRYEFLINRGNYSASPTVGNGLLMVKLKGALHCIEEEALDGLFRRSKKARLVENHVIYDCPPPGKPLCLRVPPELVGDVYQAWELLWRFHEILSLKEPLSLEELEEELINPWSDGTNLLEKFEKETQGSRGVQSHRIDGTGGSILSPSCKSAPSLDAENPHVFIQMETGATKEAALAKLASLTYSRSSGVALTKAHKSLLRVLIGELQSKVAALVDPNFDSGESKSKRGRKKDVDSVIPAKITKINMLPINELTWPELARRYILAVLSMDGNLDSAEITARESGKVFRCLKGDGGVLCGSLTGVAGMEADALLLAEATKQIFGSLNRENDVLAIEDEGSDANATGASEKNCVNGDNIPEWAKVLEPVRKLPTNVGTRIRKCVYEALDKGPPEWAKKILEHSISREVYKGNASGPTKKAVLSVLADVCGDKVQQKSVKGAKQKTFISMSDIIMKRCRIVLRHAAAADDTKVFCTLLGRKPINSSDNDDEGFLGSPAMVSRPLDFRTIDLRLATGAYGGSHEAFLEDIRELWNTIRTAYGDQPDLVELAETLSQNFELLYEKEVATVVQKFGEYAKLEKFSAETRKEIDGFLASTNEIPKAPWDEEVCRVCGIDRDDDSVLLCDTCDAEYHTYCLDPPLARIPEGNWYCPTCAGKRMVQDASERVQVICRRQSKKYQGEVTRVYLEALTQLSSVMEEKEYWEFSVGERTFLLKFLCDELLNSALIRQHLEQCPESSAELQQKLRSLSVELKNLKAKEENLAARAAKADTSLLNGVGEVNVKEGVANKLTNQGNCLGRTQISSDTPNHFGVFSNELPHPEGDRDESGLNGVDKHPPVVTGSENNIQFMNYIDTEVHLKDVNGAVDDRKVAGNVFSHSASQETDKSSRPNGLPVSNSPSQEINGSAGDMHFQDNLQEYKGREISLSPSDRQGHSTATKVSSHAAQHAPVGANESQACHLELNSVKNDIALLQDSITSVESQLFRLSVRREFLGTDSVGRFYWASVTPGGHPRFIVCGRAMQHGRKMMYHGAAADKFSVLLNSALSGIDNHEGSKASCPFLSELNDAMALCSSWFCYETDAEIHELTGWLKTNDPKGRELKESILQWQKLRFQDSFQSENEGQDEHQAVLSLSRNSELAGSSNCLVSKAATLLEEKYGPCFELETIDILKKRGKKVRVVNDEKMYRCDCLELIWPSRHHCHSCHRSFSNDVELEGHNDGRCSFGAPAFEKGKEITDVKKGKGNPKCEVVREECTGEMDGVETSKGGRSQPSSRLIKYQNEGLVCPYDFDEISSKFVTKDSNKDLVQEIGLLRSNGIPSLVPSTSPYLGDSKVVLIPQEDVGLAGDGSKATERPVSEENTCITNAGHDCRCDNSPRRSANEVSQKVLKTNKAALGRMEKREKISSLDGYSLETGVGRCCVVPVSSLRPLVGKVSQISRRLKINLLDMDAALPEEALRPSKSHVERRWAWRAFVKSAGTIYEMVQATIVLEDLIRTEYLRNDWWYWSSLSAAAKTSTLSSLALRIFSLDAAIMYEKISSCLDSTENLEPSSIPDPKPLPSLELAEKSKVTRRSNKKRKGVPRSLLPGVRSSRLRDRQKEERELLVKKAFIEDILKENIKLSNLLGKVSTCHAVLWNADLLPYPSRDSQLPSIVATDSTSPRENASHIHTENNNNIQNDLIHEMNLYIETLNDLSLDGDDLSCDFQVDSGTLACVACGILGFPFMSVVQPSEEASLKLQPMDHRLVQGGPRVSGPENACSSPDCDGFIKSNIPENLPPVPDVSLPPKDLKMSLLTKFDTQWNTSSKFLRPRIFCLEHAIEIVELLQSKGGVNMLMICHSDYQKMKAHAVAVSEEIGKPFDYNEVPLDTASQEDLNLIDLAIDDEEHDECGEDWTSKLGINLRYCAKVRKNSPSMQVQHALTLGGLFSEKSATSECLTVKWQSRRSRSRKSNHSSHGKVCDTAQSKKDEVLGGRSNGIIVNNEKKLIQYSRRNPKLKLGGSTDASTVDGCPGKNLSKDVSAATYGDRDKQSGKATENDLSNKGNSKSDAVFVFSNASGVSEMQHESSGFAATSGGSLNSAPSRIEDSPASDTLVVVETQSENHTLDDFDIDGKACNVATWDGSEMQHKIKSTDETKEEDKTTYAKKCGSPLIIATDERSGMQAENQSKEKISITNESFHLVSEGQCNVSTEGDVLMNEVSDLSKPPTPHIADPVVRNFEAQMENVVLEESCINSKVLVCATLDNEVQQKIHTTSRIEYNGPLSSNVAPINRLTLASTEGVSCNIAVTNQPTLASMQESCEGPTEIRAAEDISIAMSSDAVEQELESENGSTEDEPVSSYVIPTNEPTPASREIHSPDRNNEELVSSSVSPMEVSQPCVSLEQCPEVPRGCSAEEDLHDGVTLDTEVQQDIQTSDGTDEGMPVPSFITQVEKEPVTLSGGQCYKVPRGINAEENLSGGVALDNEVEQKKELTNENDEEFSEYDTLINPPSPAPIQKRSRIQRDTHVENLLHKEVCSSQDDRELESIESTLLEPRSSTDKRRKRKREADHLTENKFGCSDFIRSPCEGLRPRAGKDATSRCGIDTSKIVVEKLVRKKVSKASDVPLPPKNKNSMGSHKCDLEGCRMSFKTKAELLLHKRNRCPHEGCGKRFSNHKYAMLHKRVHDDDRPLKCPWKGCTMSFKWAWARTEHIRVHTGERPYKCKVEGCGLSFRFVSDYSRHRRKTGHYVNSPA